MRIPACVLPPCTLLLAVALLPAGHADEKEPVALDVPYEPTHPQVVDAMLDLAGVTAQDVVYDLGCGDGRIVIRAARRFGARGLGVDLDPQRVREAREIAQADGVGELVQFREADILQTDIRPASVVTLYLLNTVNLMLRPKLFAELAPGTRIVSHAFHMDDWAPDREIEHPRARGNVVYYWVIPAAVGGTWRWSEPAGEAVLLLHQQFQHVSGSLLRPGAPLLTIDTARIQGREFTLELPDPQDPARRVTYRGQVDGDTITGTQQEPAAAAGQPWQARRDAVQLGGSWQLSGAATGMLRIQNSEGRWQATYQPGADQPESAVAAFYAWGGSVRFEIARDDATLVCTGLFDKDQATGACIGGQGGAALEWTARRLAATPAASQPAPRGASRRWNRQSGPPQAGDEYVNPTDGSVLVWIPGGDFTMGNDAGPDDERPAHRVRVDGFWLGRYEVTNAQFARFMKTETIEPPMFWDDAAYRGDDQPVVGILFGDARSYCEWAGLRLPTEAEWEYAARAGGTAESPTATGEFAPGLANVRGTAAQDRWEQTAPVGSFPPNPLGLYDLAGNAWEWVSSRFAPYPFTSDEEREEPYGGMRVLRGGSWGFGPEYATSTHRRRFSAYLHYDFAGFRVALSPEDADAANPVATPKAP